MEQAISNKVLRHLDLNAYATHQSTKTTLLRRFSNWLDKQEQSRLLWLGIAVLGGIATVLPITLLAIVFLASNSFTLWVITLAINVPVLITNLSAQPAKITIPILFFAWLVNAIIIAYSVAIFFIG